MLEKLKQLNIKRIDNFLKSYYLVLITFLLLIFFIFVSITIWKESNKKLESTINHFTYIKDRQLINRIHTESDRYSKITTFYSEIASVYFNKYKEKYNQKNNWMYQGLNDAQLAQIINLWYKGSRDFNIGYMILPAIAVRESSGNPISRTYNLDESYLEVGLYNNRREAVNQAREYFLLASEYLQKEYSFYFTKMEDLMDPVNATKIELFLIWGEKIYYKSDPTWYLTSVHWGNYKISLLYHNGILPPKDYTFNANKINEDVRNPFVYYFIINQYISSFEHFSVEVRIDHHYEEVYKKACSRMEKEYINSYKYFSEMVDLYEEMKNDKKEYYKKREEKLKKLEFKINNMNKEYIESRKIIHEGNYKKVNDVFKSVKNKLYDFLKNKKDK